MRPRSMDWSSCRAGCRSARLSISRSRRQVRTTYGRILLVRGLIVPRWREDGVDAFQELALEGRPDRKDADRRRGFQWHDSPVETLGCYCSYWTQLML